MSYDSRLTKLKLHDSHYEEGGSSETYNVSDKNSNKAASRPGLLAVNNQNQMVQTRSVTQYSLSKGKRRIVHVVLRKFYRLDWGIWIRARCGRQKRLYRKSSAHKRRLKQHVFCNAQQSTLLDKMVSKFYRRPKYFVDDPYEPYHKREEFGCTRKLPLKSELL